VPRRIRERMIPAREMRVSVRLPSRSIRYIPKAKTTFIPVNFKDASKEYTRAGIFKESMGARNRGGRGLSYGPPCYIGWRNSFLEIDSGAPYTFKNTGSGNEKRNFA
jgi:hypothetical protein